jgi:hypothetical protein
VNNFIKEKDNAKRTGIFEDDAAFDQGVGLLSLCNAGNDDTQQEG